MDNVRRHVDKYGYLTFTTPKLSDGEMEERTSFSISYPSDSIPVCGKKRENAKCTFIIRDIFFACNCKKNANGTRNLILNGRDLEAKIGRRLKNWDVPYLTIFLSKNHNITKLHLVSNHIDSAGFMSLIDYVISHEYIDELDLRNNKVGEPGINYMYRHQDKLKLRVLRLSGNKIGVKCSKIIAMTVANNIAIKRLDVAEIDQTESSLIYFTTVLRSDQRIFNETLKILDLSCPIPQCRYSKFDSSHIANAIGLMLRYNVILEELHLQKFDFSCHDIEELIINAKHNKTLKLLDLSCNNIGDFGAKSISTWLEKRPSLRALLLSRNMISNQGISELSKGIEFSKLVMIDVSYNHFDDVGGVELLRSFKKSPMVKSFKMFGNNVAHNTAKIIEKWLQANIINQENIDIRPYQLSDNLHLAYYLTEKSTSNVIF
ncbi:hypothetical protein TSAR_016590 [Trichomalopsis sarcophagae]|uniref:Uncharacterized protein n=1 Tax=Trichomalopsis sarcophagae TaxID=543379 RepID=A0A232F275_9HYME|nr:hypothetical protein TSAR_016590 [Trichomalopsis sarcophagae]